MLQRSRKAGKARPTAGLESVSHETLCGMNDVMLALEDLKRPARRFHASNRTRLVDCGISFSVYGDRHNCQAFYPHTIRDVADDPREREIAFRVIMARFWWQVDIFAEMERAGKTGIVIHLERAA
jgi:hypothetical protein